MAVYKRGGVYWFEFSFRGERVRESTHVANLNTARQIEAARKTELAKGQVGIVDKPRVPTLREFAPRFETAIETLNADKDRTIRFYKERLRRLLEYEPFASAQLDAIEEESIEFFKHQRQRQISCRGTRFSIASINRELSALSRVLNLANEWKVIDRVPRIRKLRGEKNRDFVVNYSQERIYLEEAPQPLRDAALLIADTGVRPDECGELPWSCVRLKPALGSRFGHIRIEHGKSKNAKRNLSLTERVQEMLERRRKDAPDSQFVFGDGNGQSFVWSLDRQHVELRERLKERLGLQDPSEFVVYSFRHTMLTRLGESGADAFTIMKIAGHSDIRVSQRYVHPSPESQERAFERLDALNRSYRGEDAHVPTISTTVTKQAIGGKAAKYHIINTRARSSAG